jgi:hypothetical protein
MESKKDRHLLIKCVTEVWMRLKRHIDRNHAFFCALCVCEKEGQRYETLPQQFYERSQNGKAKAHVVVDRIPHRSSHVLRERERESFPRTISPHRDFAMCPCVESVHKSLIHTSYSHILHTHLLHLSKNHSRQPVFRKSKIHPWMCRESSFRTMKRHRNLVMRLFVERVHESSSKMSLSASSCALTLLF